MCKGTDFWDCVQDATADTLTGMPIDEGLLSVTTAAPSYTPKQLTVSAVRQSDRKKHKKQYNV